MRIKRFNENKFMDELEPILNIARDEYIGVEYEIEYNFYGTRQTGNIIFDIQDSSTPTNISEEELNFKLRIIENVLDRLSDVYKTEEPFIKFIDFSSSVNSMLHSKLLKDLTVINKKNYKICSVLIYLEEMDYQLS